MKKQYLMGNNFKMSIIKEQCTLLNKSVFQITSNICGNKFTQQAHYGDTASVIKRKS